MGGKAPELKRIDNAILGSIMSLRQAGHGWDEISRRVTEQSGMTVSPEACRHRYRVASGTKRHSIKPGPGPADAVRFKQEISNDVQVLEYNGDRIQTADDAVKAAGVDLAIWEIEKVWVNGWDVTAKVKTGDDEELQTKQNRQIKVMLRRKIAKPFADTAAELIERMASHAPKYKYTKPKPPSDPHMLEVSVFDAHFGKLAWAPETGQDYDLAIAETVYSNAVSDLLGKVSGYNVERILYPIGQDFFHIDGHRGETINGTIVDRDSRYAKMFMVGCLACIHAVERMVDVAPVEVVWIPGNHDRTASWHLAAYLGAWFRNHNGVTVNCSPNPRKYLHYGVNLIGLTHGDEERHADLPAIMAAEAKNEWADSSYREWHVGHWHKRKETRYNAGDTYVGVPVRVLPSLSGTDYWHHLKGYVNNSRAAEAYLWSKANGYTGHFSSNVEAQHGDGKA